MIEFVVITSKEERHEFDSEEALKRFLAKLNAHYFDDVQIIKIEERVGYERD